jgi:hypothetical protein
MQNFEWQKTLSSYETSEWKLTLHSGDEITIFADSKGDEGEFYVFEVLIAGSPPTLHRVARIPAKAVSHYETTYIGRATPETQ